MISQMRDRLESKQWTILASLKVVGLRGGTHTKKTAADAIANQRSAVSLNVERELKGTSQTVKRKEMDITIQLMNDCFHCV
jgi:hypothetical protein